MNCALENAEKTLGIKAEGDFFARLYKTRHECWDRIFVPGHENFKSISKIQRSVMDLKAGEAWYASRHQEFADFGWYFKMPVPAEDTALHLKAEYVQNLYDFANRTMGGALSTRAHIQPSKVILKAQEPINLTDLLARYNEDKRGTIALAMEQLEKSFINCVNDVNKDLAD